MLRRIRCLRDPEKFWFYGIGRGCPHNRFIDGWVARSIELISKAACRGHRIGLIWLGIRADNTREIDLNLRLFRGIAAERKLDNNELVSRRAVNHAWVAGGIFGEGMRCLPTRIKLKHSGLQRHSVVRGAIRLEGNAVVRRQGRVAHLWHDDIDERGVADVGRSGRSRIVEADNKRHLLVDEWCKDVVLTVDGPPHGGRGNAIEGIPPLKPFGQQSS